MTNAVPCTRVRRKKSRLIRSSYVRALLNGRHHGQTYIRASELKDLAFLTYRRGVDA